MELEAENWRLWSVPTCFVKEHRSSANQPATCPFPIGLFFWKLPLPACPGTTCIIYIYIYANMYIYIYVICVSTPQSECMARNLLLCHLLGIETMGKSIQISPVHGAT